PEISVLSDDFLDSLAQSHEHENTKIRLLRKLLDDEIKSRRRSNYLQARAFGDEIAKVLARYKQRQLTSADVVERLVALAKELREARHRHEDLGLSEEEVAFYDALAGGVQHLKADRALAGIAHELVKQIQRDLTVDWTRRSAAEAKIRAKIKRLLRKHRDK